MIVGDVKDWIARFIGLDERILARIAVVWPKCVAVLPKQPREDEITMNLVALLVNDPVVRRICYWIEYQFEPFGVDQNGAKFSKGIIDVAIFLDWERESYLAYECKRLNVRRKNGPASLAMEYVRDGMMRFITEQYAEALPVGCMLGYVLDGNCAVASQRINLAMRMHSPLGLASGPSPSAAVGPMTRFSTLHNRASKIAIELRHTLIPFG